MLKDRKLACLLGAGTVALLLGASPVHAQLGNPNDNAKATANARVGEGDQEMMEDIAHANLAEISTGKMALEKGQSDAVKKMAQKMIDDHTRAQEELEKLASSKGVKLPTETDVQHKTMATALEGLSGKAFDDQYIKRVGVGDHQRAHDLLKKVSTQAKDPQLKAYAAKTIKGVDSHLAMAKKMQGAKDSGK
jgi:putative membrane protein